MTENKEVDYSEIMCESHESETIECFIDRINRFLNNSSSIPIQEQQRIAQGFLNTLHKKLENIAAPDGGKQKRTRRRFKDTRRVKVESAIYALSEIGKENGDFDMPAVSESLVSLLENYIFTRYSNLESFCEYLNEQEISGEIWGENKLAIFISKVSEFIESDEDRKKYLTRLLCLDAVKGIEWSDTLLMLFSGQIQKISRRELRISLLYRFNNLPRIKNRKDRLKTDREPWNTLFYEKNGSKRSQTRSSLPGIMNRGDRPTAS